MTTPTTRPARDRVRRLRSLVCAVAGLGMLGLAMPAAGAGAAPAASGLIATTDLPTDEELQRGVAEAFAEGAPEAGASGDEGASAQAEGAVLIFTATTQFRHTDAINQGTPVLTAALEAEGMEVTHTEDPAIFNDEQLAEFDAIMMFQTSGDPWNAEQKASLMRYVQAGGGISAVHNATDMRGEWDWWDNLVGTTMPGHAATGTDPGLPGTVRVEDHVHPSTDHLEQRWERADEWYNYETNVRGDAHVLATMDEETYEPGGNAMGYDHPISWCRPYDGGSTWVTGMGHFGSHYTDETELVDHIVGGTLAVAGQVESDCGGTDWNTYERVSLDENTSAPFAMDVAESGEVFFTELVRGQIRVYDPETRTTRTALTIPVYSGGEDGLLGITLANDFAESGHLYIYYSPASEDDTDEANFISLLSRLTYDHETGLIDRATEEVLLEVPARRLPDEPGHTGGGLDMDADGNLYLGVGDDVNPHSEPSGGYAPLSTREGTFHDARETSANTNDLRGKLLRIHPEDDGSYTIPEGNLFPEAEDTDDKTLPEIYAMGFRNPFRFSVDQQTGHISLADYSPDNNTDAPATRGPAGIAEWHLVKSPGNYGWPFCAGQNEPYRDVDYGTTSSDTPVVGEFFDCEAPVNDSPRNTGLTELPPARGADLAYGYQRSTVPEVIPAGGGLAPMGGPVYSYDPELESDTKFPAYYDGKPFFYEWARNKMYSVLPVDSDGEAPGDEVEKVNEFLPEEEFLAPIDSRFGPDGSLYVLDWGGGFGRDNPNSGLHRIDYIQGSRSPVAVIDADPTSGQGPLTVTFDGTGSTDPEGEELTYAWDFDGDGEVDSTEPVVEHTYTENGRYDARLIVTDPAEKEGTTTQPITVGNTAPTVDFSLPPNGSFFDFGDDLTWDVSVTDPEDGDDIDGSDVVIQPALGHDEHAHPTQPLSGLTGTTPTSLGGHQPDENIFYAIDARYTDKGGDGVDPLTGSDTTLVMPKLKEAEFFTETSDDMGVGAGRDLAGGGRVLSGADGAWASYSPVNLYRIDQLALRVSAPDGGPIELRRDAPDGELLAEAEVPATGSRYTDVVVDVDDPGETFGLYVVMPGEGVRRLNFIEALGQGSSPDTRPVVSITAPAEGEQLEPGSEVEITADATDAAHDVEQVEFFVEGESVGVDTEAPWSATWQAPTEEAVYELTAVATNSEGATTTSRVSGAQVGEPFGGLTQFSNAGGDYSQLGPGAFRITGAGANAWLDVDEYSSLYAEGGAEGDSWEAVVRVDAETHANSSAKSGLIVRNDVTATGESPGYAILGLRPDGAVEWLRDTDGSGFMDIGTDIDDQEAPVWLRITREGDEYTGSASVDGETWTQVGETTVLEGAADVQDVGMVTLAHGSAVGSADFSEFSVSGDGGEEPGDDGDAPTTELTTDPAEPAGQEGWHTSAPTFALSADDGEGSGVESTEYRLGAGEWTAYDEPVTLDEDGEWEVGFRSTDAAGNVEDAKSATVKVDTTAPVTSISSSDVDGGVRVSMMADDETSGVAATEYRLDGGEWVAYDDAFVLDEPGSVEVEARSTDVAGLSEEEPAAATVVVPEPERAGAKVRVTGLVDGATYGSSQRPNVGWAAQANGHRVTSVVARLDGRVISRGRIDLARLTYQPHTLVVRAIDASGKHTVVTIRFRVRATYADTATLARRYAEQGAMRPAVRRQVVVGLQDARRLSNRPVAAERALVRARTAVAEVGWPAPRAVLRRSVNRLIADLR